MLNVEDYQYNYYVYLERGDVELAEKTRRECINVHSRF